MSPASQPATSRDQVLIAGASAQEQNLYFSFLKWFADVTFAFQGADVLRKVEESLQPGMTRYGLIITDARVGQMTGLELLEQLLLYEPAPPKLMIAASPDPEKLHCDIKQRGGLGLIEKPVNFTDLQIIVQELLGSGWDADPGIRYRSRRLEQYFKSKGREVDIF